MIKEKKSRELFVFFEEHNLIIEKSSKIKKAPNPVGRAPYDETEDVREFDVLKRDTGYAFSKFLMADSLTTLCISFPSVDRKEFKCKG